MSAKVYILCGKIASGKTTYAKEVICKQEKAVLLSVDEVMLKMFDACLKDKHNETVEHILDYFCTLIPDLLELGVSCIIDYGFWTKSERKHIVDKMKKHQFPFEMIYIRKEESLRVKHLEKRNEDNRRKDGRQFIIEGKLLEKLDDKFEEIEEDEVKTVYIS